MLITHIGPAMVAMAILVAPVNAAAATVAVEAAVLMAMVLMVTPSMANAS